VAETSAGTRLSGRKRSTAEKPSAILLGRSRYGPPAAKRLCIRDADFTLDTSALSPATEDTSVAMDIDEEEEVLCVDAPTDATAAKSKPALKKKGGKGTATSAWSGRLRTRKAAVVME